MARSLVVLVCCLVLAQANRIYVSPHGNDQNPGTEAAPLKTLVRAAGLAFPHDEILVMKGRYSGVLNHPVVEVNVSFISVDGAGEAVVHGAGQMAQENCFYIAYEGSFVGFHGMVIEDCYIGVSVTADSHVHFNQSTLRNVYHGVETRDHPVKWEPVMIGFHNTTIDSCHRAYLKGSHSTDKMFGNGLNATRTHFDPIEMNLEFSEFYEASAEIMSGKIYQSYFERAKLELKLEFPLTIERSTFEGDGGTAVKGGPGLLDIFESVFQHNNATTLDLRGTFATLHGVTFAHCLGDEGGAIKLSHGAALNCNNCHFRNNEAHKGGAIYCKDSTATIVNSDFDNNSAKVSGGAVQCDNCLGFGENNHHRGNTAPGDSACDLL